MLLPFNLEGFWWAGIADGMGGRPGGDVASAAVVDTIHSAVTIQHCSDVEKLFSLARERNQRNRKGKTGTKFYGDDAFINLLVRQKR